MKFKRILIFLVNKGDLLLKLKYGRNIVWFISLKIKIY